MSIALPKDGRSTSTNAAWSRRESYGQRDSFGRDLYQGIVAWPIWSAVGWNDIRQRYRRSVLGPLWITLSMGVLVGSLGLIYSQVFHTDIKTYLPFLCLGFVIWGFISSSATECCTAFLESEAIIKQIKLPFSVYILRVLWRNFIVFLHTIIIFIPVALIFGERPSAVMLLALPGLLLVYLNILWLGFVLVILGTRFRDVSLIVTNLLQFAFFGTPILWPAGTLGDHPILAEANPLYHLIEIVRAPLLGEAPRGISWCVSLGSIIVGSLAAMALFRRTSRRIAYWL
jgi:ABC-type polysaccharide/polyol phosphate export permease